MVLLKQPERKVMKRNVIAVLLSVALAAGSFGPAPLYAAEVTTQGTEGEQDAAGVSSENDTLTNGEDLSDEAPAEEGAGDAATEENAESGGAEEANGAEGAATEDGTDTASAEDGSGTASAEEGIETAATGEDTETAADDGTGSATTEESDGTAATEGGTVPALTTEPTAQNADGQEETQTGAPDNVVNTGTCGDNVTWTLTNTGGGIEDREYTLTLSGSGDMYDYYASSGSYHIQSIGRPITEIQSAPPWYGDCYDIQTVVVEEGITYIGKNAFCDFTSLTSVSLPESLTAIGDYAFRDSGIVNLTLPSQITELGTGVFNDCRLLESMSIPAGVTDIPDELFYSCASLADVTLPDNLNTIGFMAFYECTSLSDISIPDSVTQIGESAFNGCSSLTDITLPSGLTETAFALLARCTALENVSVPDTVTTLGAGSFAECTALTSIDLPANLTVIDWGAFQACSSLTEVVLPQSLKSIERLAFEECGSLTSMDFPVGLESIGDYAFRDCVHLAEIVVPGKDTEVSANAFYGDEELLRCYTVHGAYIADHAPKYNENDSVTTIIYMDGEDDENEFAFITDKIVAHVGETIYLEDYINYWRPKDEESFYRSVKISNQEDFSQGNGINTIYCKSVGETEISMNWCGKTDTIKIICVDGDIPEAEGVVYKESEITVVKGQYFSNPLVLVPENSRTDSGNIFEFISGTLCPHGWEVNAADSDVVDGDQVVFYAASAGTTTVSLTNTETGEVLTEFEVTVVESGEPTCSLLIKDTDIEVEKGTTKSLNVMKIPEDNTDPVSFESSDNSIAEVSETGVITAKDYGIATITITCGNVTRKIKVTVPCHATGISLPESVVIEVNENIEIMATLTPSNSTDVNVEWEVSDSDVLFLGNYENYCFLGGKGIGTATLTATVNGHTATTEVTVVKGTPQFDEIDPIEAKCGQKLSELELPYGFEWQNPDQGVGNAGEHTYAATYVPDDPERYNTVDVMVQVNVSHDFIEEWTTSDGTRWYRCKCGEVTSENGNKWVSVSSLSLDKSEMTIYTGMDDMIGTTVLPEDASEKNIEWTTSNENVVAVDEYGTVVAVGAGDAVITATTADGGLTAQCTVHVLKEPEIVQNPADVDALVGDKVEFAVSAEGDGLKYQWQWSSDGDTWKNCTNTSYNTDTFRFVMKEKFAGRRYRCIVTAEDRRLISEAALLSLKESDEIIAHPDDVEAEEGDEVAFIVEFSGDHPTYQWQWSSDGKLWRNCTGASYNTDTFTFIMHERYAGRRYRCKVTEDGETYYSEAALLSLLEVNEILAQPDNAEAAIGDTVSFIVEFSGDDPEYQWQWSLDGSTWKNCTNESYNTNTFSFVMQDRFAGRLYRCVITAEGEEYISDSALLTLSTDVRITKHPDDVTVAAGKTASFHIEATGKDLIYQWQWSLDGTTWKNCTSSGYKTDTLSFRAQTTYTGRRYRCRVSSGTDKNYSEVGVLTVTK